MITAKIRLTLIRHGLLTSTEIGVSGAAGNLAELANRTGTALTAVSGITLIRKAA